MGLFHYFRIPALGPSEEGDLIRKMNSITDGKITGLKTEFCFNVESMKPLSPGDEDVLRWLLSETFEPTNFSRDSFLMGEAGTLLEVGPRMNFSTAWSTNAVSICHACGLSPIKRIERSRRYLLQTSGPLTEGERTAILGLIHDRMTECTYPAPLETFDAGMLHLLASEFVG